jgi:hypothetical protein
MIEPSEIVDSLLEASGSKTRRLILQKMDAVRKRPGLSANYAQLVSGPFGAIPSYAEEDPNSEWWDSSAAQNLLRTLTDMLSPDSDYGVKPGGPTHVYPGARQSWQKTDRDVAGR